jgi:myo-inositol-1(or 4)-monophosphatase
VNPHAELLPLALEAVDQARSLILGGTPGVVRFKGDRDMVSELDQAVEDAVRMFLSRVTPGIGLLGEEQGTTGPDSHLRWLLDPIDGTANLLHGIPLCAVSLALVAGDRPVLGVIDLPFLDSRYTATAGGGASCDGQTIRVSPVSSLVDAVVSIGDYAVGEGSAEKNKLRLAVTAPLAGRAQRVRMFGSAAIDLAWLAHGRTDATIILSNKPWDIAAGVIIAQEAGAIVMDRDGTPHVPDSTATIAASPGIANEILHLLNEATADPQ